MHEFRNDGKTPRSNFSPGMHYGMFSPKFLIRQELLLRSSSNKTFHPLFLIYQCHRPHTASQVGRSFAIKHPLAGNSIPWSVVPFFLPCTALKDLRSNNVTCYMIITHGVRYPVVAHMCSTRPISTCLSRVRVPSTHAYNRRSINCTVHKKDFPFHGCFVA